jgi:hypothetical protein
MNLMKRRQFLLQFWNLALATSAYGLPIGSLLGNQNSAHVRFLLEKYWAWYQKEFFQFHQHLNKQELSLVHGALRAMPSWNEYLRGDHALDRFVVGHEGRGRQVQSGRLMIYTNLQQASVRSSLHQILRHRGLQKFLDQKGSGEIYGVGWSVDDDLFKLYMRYPDLGSVPDHEIRKLEDSSTNHQSYYKLRIVGHRFRSGRAVAPRLYRVADQITPEIRKVPLFGRHITQVTEILSREKSEPAHWRLRLFPRVPLSQEVEAVLDKQSHAFRFAADSVRWYGEGHGIFYYP